MVVLLLCANCMGCTRLNAPCEYSTLVTLPRCKGICKAVRRGSNADESEGGE
jgi:hypothetical protein